MTIHDVEQGTPEWLALRLGRFTASEASSLMAKSDTQTYQNLVNDVVFERLTGESPETFSNDWMQRGRDLEAFAREAYELERFQTVQTVGFISDGDYVGASPDGLVGKDGLVEIKCPKPSTLITYLTTKKVPSNYVWQIQFQLMVTERQWCDFVGYHPKCDLLIVRVFPDEKAIAQIKERLTESIKLVEERLSIIRKGK